MDKVKVFQSKANGLWWWRRRSENGQVVAGPEEGYAHKSEAWRMARQVNDGSDVEFVEEDDDADE